MLAFFRDIYFWYFLGGSCLWFSLAHYSDFLRFKWKDSFGANMGWGVICFTIAIFLNNGIFAGIVGMIFQTIYFYVFFPAVFLILNYVGQKLNLDIGYNDKLHQRSKDANPSTPETKVEVKDSLAMHNQHNPEFKIFTITPITILEGVEIFSDKLLSQISLRNKETFEILFIGFFQHENVWEDPDLRKFLSELDTKFPYWLFFLNKQTKGLLNITYALSDFVRTDDDIIFNNNDLIHFSESHHEYLLYLWKVKRIGNADIMKEIANSTCDYYWKHYRLSKFKYESW